ncbi:MAG: hypothetical protein AABZ60_24895, partial [Planctomycetota bacterium]
MTLRKKFSIVELMIVVAVIAIIISIATAAVLRSRVYANETSTIASLRSTITSQATMLQSVIKDRDSDGRGEFGFYTELGGVLSIPTQGGTGNPIDPALISSALGITSRIGSGIATHSGYHFQIYLPAGNGTGPAIEELGVVVPPIASAGEIDAQEIRWAVYAWPASVGISGNKSFFASYKLEILFTSNFDTATDTYVYGGAGKPESGDIYNVAVTDLETEVV